MKKDVVIMLVIGIALTGGIYFLYKRESGGTPAPSGSSFLSNTGAITSAAVASPFSFSAAQTFVADLLLEGENTLGIGTPSSGN